MKRSIFVAPFLILTVASAQPTVAPTNELVGTNRGTNVSEYNIRNSFEVGYRFRSVGGDLGKFRSDVNFGNGLRVLGSSLYVNSRDGKGHLFDELVISTQGLGNDPYQSAMLRLQKNKTYRYDMMWRSNDYFNPAAAIARGQHLMNTTRQLQDHDLTLFPQAKYQLYMGFSRNTQNGPAWTTTNLLEHIGDEFTLLAGIRRQQAQYRFGGRASLGAGLKLDVLRGWENFKEDTPYDFYAVGANGANLADETTLQRYAKREPYHGNSPFWRIALFRENSNWWAVNGRFTYTDGRRNFVSDESLLGGTAFGPLTRQIITLGDARRPVATGNLTVSLFPTEQITVTNHTAVSNVRMDGQSNYLEFNSGSLDLQRFSFQYFGILSTSNATDVSVTATKWLTAVAGYQYTNRRIRTVESDSFFGGAADRTAVEQTNNIHSGRFGLRLRPAKPISITLDSEVGRADQPIYPTSDRNYHLLNGRVQYKTKSVLLAMYAKTNYNFNSTSITSFSSRARSYGVDASWNARPSFSIQGGYSKLHTDTLSGIAYFVDFNLQRGTYAYLSNIHTGYLTLHTTVAKRVDLLTGFSRVEDTADGTNRNGGSLYQATTRPFYFSAETFPMAFTSPMGRISIRLHERLRWNAAYQYYGYRQSFASLIIPNQGYRAHTGFTSLSWAF
ncbi:hypothetical protein F183_A32100 [Bryobacterales bacterium F-183]|nr:hypothetical protein F183_A32100 [Bryobacterales bacterium F-183]